MPEKNVSGSVRDRLQSLGYAGGKEKKGFSVDADDIPGMIMIGGLSEKYEAARFPHRLIIDELKEHVRKSRIATHFHGGDDMICAGCHHHSPPGQIPPRCGSCHGEPFDEKNLSMPGLTGAYHQQCMGCHQEMGLHEINTCTSCHEAKETPFAQGNLPRKEEDR
jgi:DnaJ-class molecular chaperone